MPSEQTPRAAWSLTETWPELAGSVDTDQWAHAERLLVAPLVTAEGEELVPALAAHADAFAFVITRGVVLKETILAGRSSLELLTEGDVLAPLTAGDGTDMRPGVSSYQALGSASAAVLGDRFRLIGRRWPGVTDVLHSRLADQHHQASLRLAALHLPRAEDRIVVLFIDLARRLGRVTPGGIVINLPLTHDVIGRLTGSRRPTVSLALRALEENGSLTARGREWLLSHGAWNGLSGHA
ncbi:MAG: family transcriptional regulator, cyclic receptor protein [Solirubrobacteraceae bacterium]|jgi:CRP-like cAMP-binding protein|nr:family transcriptional regulator, cyclic receptor protein [Solirubrobacteraceae bacterium]